MKLSHANYHDLDERRGKGMGGGVSDTLLLIVISKTISKFVPQVLVGLRKAHRGTLGPPAILHSPCSLLNSQPAVGHSLETLEKSGEGMGRKVACAPQNSSSICQITLSSGSIF